MVTVDEPRTVADFWRAAEAQLAEAEASESDTTLPVVEDKAEGDTADEPAVESRQSENESADEVEGEDINQLLDLLAESDEAESEAGEAPPPSITDDMDALWATEVDVVLGDGPRRVKLSELRDGYMMQADYTRKTQALADARKAFEADSAAAKELWDKFQADPKGVARWLAQEAGWIEPDGTPVREVEVAKLRTQEDVEAEVQRRVEEKLAEHPQVQAAQVAAAEQAIQEDFTKIEEKYGITLTDEHRANILQEAVERQIPDLEVVLEAQLGRARAKQVEREAAVERAPARSGHVSAPADTESEGKKPTTVLEALENAERKLGLRIEG